MDAADDPLELFRAVTHDLPVIAEAEERVYQLAGRQAGYVTRRQALACGMSTDAIDRRVETKRWKRVKPGLYRDSGILADA